MAHRCIIGCGFTAAAWRDLQVLFDVETRFRAFSRGILSFLCVCVCVEECFKNFLLAARAVA